MIEGTVFDTLSGRPIPFAVVSVTNTEFTTLASRRGRYRVLVDDRETQLEFRKLGYRMKAVTVRPDDDVITRDVYLRPIPFELRTVLVTDSAENPAHRIIREAIARKNDVLSRIHDYRYDAYVKLVIRDLKKHHDSADAVVLLTETQTTAYWERPDKYLETIKGRRQSSNLDAENNLVSVGQIVNFNRDRIDLEKYSVVSPTADDALNHYDYHILDTLVVRGRTAFRLAIQPRTQGKPLFEGIIDIADSTFDVLSVEVVANEAIRFDYFDNLRYVQRLKDHGDDMWMPYEISFGGEIHIGVPIPGFPNHMLFEHTASLDNFQFDNGGAPQTLGEFLMVVDDGVDNADSSLWETGRTIPLSPLEKAAYERIDSLQSLPPSFGTHVLNGVGVAVALTSSPDFFRYNRVEGAYLGAGLTYRDLSPNVTLRGRVGHAFDRKDLQYRFGAQFRLSERQRLWVGASYHDEIVNRPRIISPRYNPTYLALLARLDPFDYYKEQGFSVFASTKLVNRTHFRLQYNEYDQSSADVVTEYSILNVDREQRPNPVIVDGKLRTVVAVLSYDSRPLLKRRGRDYYLQSLTSTRITAGVEIAAPGFIANDFDFKRYSLRILRRQRTFNLGITRIEAYAGFATGQLPPQRYFTVDFGRGAFFQTGGFNTLDETNFSGNRAAMLVVSHDFDQLLFRKTGLPLVKNIPFTLAVHSGVFWTDFRDHISNPGDEAVLTTALDPYVELGFGLGNLTPFITPLNFAVYFSWQLTSYDTTVFEFRIGVPAL